MQRFIPHRSPRFPSLHICDAARQSKVAHKSAFQRRRSPDSSAGLKCKQQTPPQTSTSAVTTSMGDSRPRRCVIIGAGFAGLAAARRLAMHSANRWEAVILEGSDRVGGRAHTVELPGCGRVEMGATWLHGLKGNPLHAYAVEKGIMSAHATQREGEWGSVRWVRKGEGEALVADRANAAKVAAGAYSMAVEESLKNCEPGMTVGQHLLAAWPKVCNRFEPQQQELAAETWAWREKLQRSMDGCRTTSDMLTAGLAVYDELDGLNVPVPGGFQCLANSMAEGLDIRLGSMVEKVEWNGHSSARVTCRNGETFQADAVIVTMSLGVLKASHQQLFSPPLPARKAGAIARMGMGCINKVYVASATPRLASSGGAGAFNLLWPVPAVTPADAFLAEQQPLQHRSSGDSSTSDNRLDWCKGAYAIRFKGSEFVTTKALASGSGGGDTDSGSTEPGSRYGGPGLADVSAAISSTQEPALAAVPQQAATMWIAGPEAIAMESRSKVELEADVAELLAAFPPVQQHLLGLTVVHRSTWGSNPLTHGSYSYPAAGSGLADIGILAEPLQREDGSLVLLFAGEATHGSHYGTAHGAFLTGEREADRLLALES